MPVDLYLSQQVKKYLRRACCLLLMAYGPISLAEMATLFTTPQERQIINANRYELDNKRKQVAAKPEKETVRQIVQEKVTRSYIISGISVSNDGAYSVWVNNQMYQDGERIDGQSKVKVIAGKNVKVRITAPDGKHYFGTSGEVVEVSYMGDVKN